MVFLDLDLNKICMTTHSVHIPCGMPWDPPKEKGDIVHMHDSAINYIYIYIFLETIIVNELIQPYDVALWLMLINYILVWSLR